MTLRDFIERLQALTPPSALDASVAVSDGITDVDIDTVSYSGGEVTIHVDPLFRDRYDEGYNEGCKDGFEDGFEAGKEDNDEG